MPPKSPATWGNSSRGCAVQEVDAIGEAGAGFAKRCPGASRTKLWNTTEGHRGEEWVSMLSEKIPLKIISAPFWACVHSPQPLGYVGICSDLHKPCLGSLWTLLIFFKSCLVQQPPTFLAPGTSFMEDHFSTDGRGEGSWFQSDYVYYIYCAFHFYCYYISPTKDHQALDPGSGGPLI